jgi:hypothetical protein
MSRSWVNHRNEMIMRRNPVQVQDQEEDEEEEED